MSNKLIKLTFGDSLAMGHVKEIKYYLRQGSLCILPSDTGYTLCGLPIIKNVVHNIGLILNKKDSIPLSFGSLNLVNDYVILSSRDERTIDTLCPGPLTLVCKIKDEKKKQTLSHLLKTEGTIGVRIPDSPVERQLSVELRSPITTCAIRYKNNKIIQKFDDAFDFVQTRMNELNLDFYLIGVKMNHIKYSDHSTVVSIDEDICSPYQIKVFRPGVINTKTIINATQKITWSEIDDMT